ncbi:MAG: MarC family protein [Bacteroidales bacterium]|nr:MarC family protein [Bacteroidales bacterium]
MNVAINLKEIFSVFMVLFAVIDITGSIPLIIDMKVKGNRIESGKIALISTVVFVLFLFLGDAILSLFGVDISSFAVAGALIILILAAEMVLGIEIFKNEGPGSSVTVVPLVFPLIAGAGALTTLLSLRAEYALINILIAIALNMAVVFVVLWKIEWVEKLLGKEGIFILRKFFGIILLAVGVKLFTSNIASLF